MVPDDFPLRLTRERVWRSYLGGRLLDALHGNGNGRDGHFPEEWIMSAVNARNTGREEFKDEGLSRLAGDTGVSLASLLEERPTAYLGEKHAGRFGARPGVLVKLIDSAERLTVQVHPDREKAGELFRSPYGKTECWHILGGRSMDGTPPCVYLGFKEEVGRELWQALFNAQDIPGMLNCLHRFEVRPGDTILIRGGVPHAIGAGCFLAEIQEPTDYTLRVERATPAGFRIDDAMCHQGLGFERMFDCFSYEGLSCEETHSRYFLQPRALERRQGGGVVQLAGYDACAFFRMDLVQAEAAFSVSQAASFSGLYILEGGGTLSANGREEEVSAGDQFFVPANTNRFLLTPAAGKRLTALNCFGPQGGFSEGPAGGRLKLASMRKG